MKGNTYKFFPSGRTLQLIKHSHTNAAETHKVKGRLLKQPFATMNNDSVICFKTLYCLAIN